MSNNQNNRVLGRLGARELTLEETHLVGGCGPLHTELCTAMNTTAARPGDGDGCSSDNDLV
jgi:hypothetical protein